MKEKVACTHLCPVERSMEIFGRRWKCGIIARLSEGTKRFGELKKTMPAITQKMLTQQLRQLEDDKIIKRKVFKEVPPKVEYSLTPVGKSIMPIFKTIQKWGEKNIPNISNSRSNA